jgi:GDP-D-mannose 3',5'-epimerase
MKSALVLGGGGFIGINLVDKLKSLGYWVRAVDIKRNEFRQCAADEFILLDLRNQQSIKEAFSLSVCDPYCRKIPFDICFQLAADMGGMGYLATGENDAAIMSSSALININAAKEAAETGVKKIFYSSSACIYPKFLQQGPVNLKESDAWPAEPDSAYGVEKIFSEVLYNSFFRNANLEVRIARFHNVFGEYTVYDGDRAKAPAALCRKVIRAKDSIEIWGDGTATRSFLYIDEAIEGVLRLIESGYTQPLNIGSSELISIGDLAKLIIEISGKKISVNHIQGPIGVQGRNSDNSLCAEVLGWSPTQSLRTGIEKLYHWIENQIKTNG